jgi:hypothetical protein
MGDWPEDLFDPACALGVAGFLSGGSPIPDTLFVTGTVSVVSTVWPTANAALWIPVLVRKAFLVEGFMWYNGATVSGNIDVGIYTGELAKITSLGSTAQSGTNAAQAPTVTPVWLDPGVYNLAVAMDNGTGTLRAAALSSNAGGAIGRLAGMGSMASAFPLPSTLTYATPATNSLSTLAPAVCLAGNPVF